MTRMRKALLSVQAAGLLFLASGSAGCLLVIDASEDCGDNAYDRNGVCRCLSGYVGDPYDYCQPDESEVYVSLWDQCNDNKDIVWQIYSADGKWIWPETGNYVTPGLGVSQEEPIVCQTGETICFGGETPDVTWGCGLDATGPCPGFCYVCDEYAQPLIEIGPLTCTR